MPALAYADADACKTAGEVPAADCDSAWVTAQEDHAANAPALRRQGRLRGRVRRRQMRDPHLVGGGSFFMPFLTGMHRRAHDRRHAATPAPAIPRPRRPLLRTPYGGRGAIYRGADGRMQVGRSAFSPAAVPPAVRTPAAARPVDNGRAVSRGGFRSTRSYAGRGYGG